MMVLIVDDLLKLPLDLSMKVLQAIAEKAEDEGLATEKAVRNRVLKTQMRYERGDLSESEYRMTISDLRSRLEKLKGE
jgi:hypothetical protein